MEPVKDIDNVPEPKFSPPKATSCFQVILATFKKYRIEPVLFMVIFGMSIHLVTSENLLIEKVCLTINKFPEDVCQNIQESQYEIQLDQVQRTVSTWSTVLAMFPILPNIIYAIVVGPWADKYGRRPFILTPLVGMVACTVVYILLSCYMYSPVYLMILPDLITSLLGMYGLFVCVSSYLIDVTTEKERTLRFGILECCTFVGVPAGISIGGALFQKYRYITVYLVSGAIEVVGLLYGIFLLPESKPNTIRCSFCEKARDLFRFSSFTDGLREFTLKRCGNNRLNMWLMLASIMCLSLRNSSTQLKLLFAQRVLHWNVTTYSQFESISLGITLLGIAVILFAASKVLKMSDYLLGIIGAVSGIVGFALMGNTATVWMFYAGNILSIVIGLDVFVLKSIMSKITGKESIGKVFSFVIVSEQATPTIGGIVMPLVYRHTLDVFPGLVFVLCSLILLVPFSVVLWLSLDQKSQNSPELLVENPVEDYGTINSVNPDETSQQQGVAI